MLLLAAARTCLSSPARPKSPPGTVPLLLRLPRSSSHHRGGPTTSLPKAVRLLRPLRAAASPGASSRPARDRVIDFGKYKGQMLGTLPPSYLRWVLAELDYGDTAHWARLARDVLDDPVYLDRVEWEHAHRFLRGDANYDYAYDDGDSEDGPLQEMADRFGWDLSDEEGWGRLDFRLLGTSYGGRIPRKGTRRQSTSNSSSPGRAKKGSLFDVGSDPDGPREKRNERRERRRLRREEEVRSAKMDMLGVNAGVKGDGALGTQKECSYYIKTGHCKFGSTCKFHHPEPIVASETPSMYLPVQPSPISSPHPYPPLASWQMGRPPVLPGSFLPGSYPPMMLPSSMQGWNPYISPVNQVASAGGQQTVQAGQFYGLSHQGPSSAVAYGSHYAFLSSSIGPSSSIKQEPAFPERPGQPECHYYMKTGTCKFGAACKYNHPQYLSAPKSNCMLSPLGLPLRPGDQPCVYYTQHGICKFGPTCKFDHPMGTLTLSYSPSASSLNDVPVAPYPLSSPVAPMALFPSSSDLRPEYILIKDSSSNLPAPHVTTCGPAGSLSKVYAPHMLIRPPTSTGGFVTSHGGEL